jgi:LysR family carnitine catabolism transcriptional activator
LAYPFIALQRPSTVRLLLERSLALEGIDLPVAMECHQLATVGALVVGGLGVSAVPAMCARQMNLLGARCVKLHSPVIERAVGLVMRSPQELSTAARAMHDMAIELFHVRGTPVLAPPPSSTR